LNPYAILGLSKNCTEEEIKQRYKQLAQLFHPDKGGDGVKFVEIKTAYEILIDPIKRNNFNDTSEVKASQKEQEAIEELYRLFENAMAEYDPSRDDILYIVKMKTIQLIDLCHQELGNIDIRIEQWEKILVNVECNQPFNIFHNLANRKLVILKEGIDHFTNRLEITDKMLNLLDSHKFSFGKMLETT
jgi:curved DNA-binding protein CbpA